jgi:hypothetical protein
MKLLSQYTDGTKHADIYYSDIKQTYLVKLDTGDSSEFFTEDEAGDWAEDWVLGKATYNMQGSRIEHIVDAGVMMLKPRGKLLGG